MILEEKIKPLLVEAMRGLGCSEVPLLFSVPKQTEHGDLSTNVAFSLTKELKKSPRAIADALVKTLSPLPSWLVKIEVAGAGFINFYFDSKIYFESLGTVFKKGKKYGESDFGKGKKVIVEFVSANPTGPLNIVSARAAALGDALANLLRVTGFKPYREFYINDIGNQIELFGKSIEARYLQALGEEAQIPAEGYQGEYLKDFASALAKKGRKKYSLEAFKKLGLKTMIDGQKSSLKRFGVVFDRWASQAALLKTKAIEKSLKKLSEGGHLYEKEGALFFKSTAFGDDKDRVVRKQDGEYSYFASDIAYHADKFARGFQWALDLLGPDHHGYVARTKASVEALGYKPDQLTVLIVQQVNLLEGDLVVKMSKRAGKLVTMDDLLDEVGKDVARYFFLQRSASAHLDFDLALAKKETPENPVFYIQYAHARIASIFRKAAESKIKPNFKKIALEHLNLPEEKELSKRLLDYPDLLLKAVEELSPHHIAFYALDLAKQFQGYYSQAKQDDRYRVVDVANVAKTESKLYLLKNIQIVLQNALSILGISAPEKMEKDAVPTV